jgi:nitrous oxide reductase
MLKTSTNARPAVDLERRKFLGTAKYAVAISVVALAGKSPASVATTGVSATAGPKASGYRETSHTRKYYESARY